MLDKRALLVDSTIKVRMARAPYAPMGTVDLKLNDVGVEVSHCLLRY